MLKILSFLLILNILSSVAFAHSGRTDRYGGHYNRKTGEYHFHSGGSVPYPIPQGQFTYRTQPPTQQRAIATANIDVKHNVSGLSWFLAGCGGLGFPYALLDTPRVPVMRLLGESPAYVQYYTEAYQSKVKDKRVIYSCLGAGVSSLLFLAYLGLTGDYEEW